MALNKLLHLFSAKRPTETKEETRQRQGRWINAKLREWQLAWHALFDQDPGQPTADNAAKTEPIPDDLDRDYRLIFGFCEVTAETRAACFALLPKGDQLAERFEQFYETRNKDIPPEAAIALAEEMRKAFKDCWANYRGNWDHIAVVDEDDEAAHKALGLECGLREAFEKPLFQPDPDDKLAEIAAELFLREPLYTAAWNTYYAGDWITGIYHPPAHDKCLEINYKLWLGGWDLLIGRNGIGLTQRRHR
ncbi:MAG: hypothetical protein CR993_04140 [Rhodobacterales bacterium]|nr:MAG: hypothetical protein CR993_04140 [Rhodobacterales bacterium]